MFDFLKNSKGDILNLFFQDTEKEYYLREIAKLLDKEPSSVQQALEYLIKEKILLDERKGNLRFFKLNKNHPLYEEIKRILRKTLGLEAQLKELVAKLPDIESAFIFGSFAKGREYGGSDIDLMLIGQADEDKLIEEIKPIEEKLKREINYQVFTKSEIKNHLLSGKDGFIALVFQEPKILLKGNLDEFR